MPAALTDAGARAWLHEGRDLDELSQRLLDHMPPAYESWPVSSRVNSPKNQDEAVAAAI
jgi:putative SOS response-associated peptidase YedK